MMHHRGADEARVDAALDKVARTAARQLRRPPRNMDPPMKARIHALARFDAALIGELKGGIVHEARMIVRVERIAGVMVAGVENLVPRFR